MGVESELTTRFKIKIENLKRSVRGVYGDVPTELKVTFSTRRKRDVGTNKMPPDARGVNNQRACLTLQKIVPRNVTAWEARERLALSGGKASLLKTNDIVVFNKVVEGPGNFLATVGGSSISLVKGKTVNVVGNNVRDTGGGGRKGVF